MTSCRSSRGWRWCVRAGQWWGRPVRRSIRCSRSATRCVHCLVLAFTKILCKHAFSSHDAPPLWCDVCRPSFWPSTAHLPCPRSFIPSIRRRTSVCASRCGRWSAWPMTPPSAGTSYSEGPWYDTPSFPPSHRFPPLPAFCLLQRRNDRLLWARLPTLTPPSLSAPCDVLQDKAMSVLKRSSSSAYEDVPGEAVAAAASVVARLTEVHRAT